MANFVLFVDLPDTMTNLTLMPDELIVCPDIYVPQEMKPHD